jgi:hypothetical protein
LDIVDIQNLESVVATRHASLERSIDGQQYFVVLRVLRLQCFEDEQSVPVNNVVNIKTYFFSL